jgi:hypothetical protein
LLFVGIGQAPWGKLYKRVGDDFEFFANVPGLSARPIRADITYDDEYLLLRSPLRVFSIGDGILTEINSSAVDSNHQRYVFAGNDHDVFSGNYTTNSFNVNRYSIIDDALVFQESFVLPIALPSYTTLRSLIDLAAVGDTIHVYGQTYYSSTGYGYGTGLSSLFMTNGVWKVAKERSFVIRYTSNSSHISGAAIINPSLFFTLGDFGVGIMSPGTRYSHASLIGADTIDNSSWAWLDDEQVLLIRDVSGSPSNLKIIKVRESITSSQSYARKWTFPAGTGTGVVNEVAIRATSGTGYNGNNRYFLRFVLPEGFEKTDLHQLEVEVEAEIENPGVWEGTIPEGSRDGSDVSYRITMSEGQFRDFITTGYNNLSTWFGTSGTPNVRIGTSNEDTDLVLDRENIRGEEIQYISSTAIREVIPYVSGSLERTIRLFLEINQGNGKIGEIVFGNRFCRVTFDPPLNKYDPEGVDEGIDPSTRLYMNLVFGWKREEE